MGVEEPPLPADSAAGGPREQLGDAELIAATRAGDAASFAVLYSRHVGAARRSARSLVRSHSVADDLVSDAFARVLGALRRGKGPDVGSRPYLLTAVRTALYDRTRRDRRMDYTDSPPDSIDAVLLGADYEREEWAAVAQAYAALPERWQTVLWYADVEGRPLKEIAQLLGMKPNSVAALAYRAREGLRQAYLQAHVNSDTSAECQLITAKLGAYVRDGLSARDRDAVREHLERCSSCTALLTEIEAVNRNLKVVLIPALAGVSAAAYLHDHIGRRILGLLRVHPVSAAASTAAAAAATLLLPVAISHNPRVDEPQAAVRSSIASGHPAAVTDSPPHADAAGTAPASPPTFDTHVPPVTNVSFDPEATTATTGGRGPTTTDGRKPTTTHPGASTTTNPPPTTTTTQPQPEATAVPAPEIGPTTATAPTTQMPSPPAIQSTSRGLGPVYSGQSAYFSVKVSNAPSGNGGSARKVAVGSAEGAIVTFDLPPDTQFAGVSLPSWQCDVAGSSVRCLLPRIEPGSETEAVLGVDVAASAVVGSTLAISPLVLVDGERIATPAVQRSIDDGAAIVDFDVLDGVELAVAGGSVVGCSSPDPADVDCSQGLGHKVPKPPTPAALDLGDRGIVRAYLLWHGDGDPSAPVTLSGPSGTDSVAPAASRTNGNRYASFADVTDLVTASGSYTVAGIATGTDINSYGGWSLMVLVQTASEQPRAVTIALPMVEPDASEAGTQLVRATGLAASAVDRDVCIATLVGEGDRGPTPAGDEELRFNGRPLSGAAHPTGNEFNSTILGAEPGGNSFGTDIDIYRASLPAQAKALTVSARANGDDIAAVSAVALVYDL